MTLAVSRRSHFSLIMTLISAYKFSFFSASTLDDGFALIEYFGMHCRKHHIAGHLILSYDVRKIDLRFSLGFL